MTEDLRGLVTGAVLVGGQSRRMGQDKASMPVAGRALAAWVADAMRPLVSELLLVGRDVPGVTGRVVSDPELDGVVGAAGPVAGIVAALAAARTPYLLVAGCDMPVLEERLLRLLLERLDASPGISAALCRSISGVEPFPVAMRTRAVVPLGAALRRGVRAATEALSLLRCLIVEPPEWVLADPEGRSFINWNVPDEVRQPLRRHPTIAAS